jgi:hypothetical protein
MTRKPSYYIVLIVMFIATSCCIVYLLGNIARDGVSWTSLSISESIDRGVFIDSVYARFIPDSSFETVDLQISSSWVEYCWTWSGVFVSSEKPVLDCKQLCLVIQQENLTMRYPEWSIGFTKGHASGRVFVNYNNTADDMRSSYYYYDAKEMKSLDTFVVVTRNRVGDTAYSRIGRVLLRICGENNGKHNADLSAFGE